VQHFFEPAFFVLPIENDLAQLAAIDFPVGVQDCFPEMVANLPVSQLPRLEQFAADEVGVDYRYAELREQFADRGFPRRDSPG
jgi:hypothetical protein